MICPSKKKVLFIWLVQLYDLLRRIRAFTFDLLKFQLNLTLKATFLHLHQTSSSSSSSFFFFGSLYLNIIYLFILFYLQINWMVKINHHSICLDWPLHAKIQSSHNQISHPMTNWLLRTCPTQTSHAQLTTVTHG